MSWKLGSELCKWPTYRSACASLQKNQTAEAQADGQTTTKKMVQLKPPSVRLRTSPSKKSVTFNGGTFTTYRSNGERGWISYPKPEIEPEPEPEPEPLRRPSMRIITQAERTGIPDTGTIRGKRNAVRASLEVLTGEHNLRQGGKVIAKQLYDDERLGKKLVILYLDFNLDFTQTLDFNLDFNTDTSHSREVTQVP
eukprot:gene423-27576_t